MEDYKDREGGRMTDEDMTKREAILKAHNLVMSVRNQTHTGWKKFDELDHIMDELKDIYFEMDGGSDD